MTCDRLPIIIVTNIREYDICNPKTLPIIIGYRIDNSKALPIFIGNFDYSQQPYRRHAAG